MNTQTNTATAKVNVVINGGKMELDQAIVPFQVFMSDEVAVQQPTHVLVVDLTEKEVAKCEEWWVNGDTYLSHRGRRDIFPLTRGTHFWQFTKPGKHRLAFILLKIPQDAVQSVRRTLFSTKRREFYTHPVDLENPGRYIHYDDGHPYIQALHASIVDGECHITDVEIPDAFFAKPVKDWVWNWVNRWHSTGPRDQCEFRRRAILAFTTQPVFLLLGKSVQYFVLAPVLSLLAILVRVIIFIVGFRPAPLTKNLGGIWSWNFALDDPEEFEFLHWREVTEKNLYRVWIPPYEKGNDSWKPKKMPVTGVEIIGLVISGYGSWCLYQVAIESALLNIPDGLIALFLCHVLALFGLLLAGVLLKRIPAVNQTVNDLDGWLCEIDWFKKAKKKALDNPEPTPAKRGHDLLYFEWLKNKFGLAKAPEKIILEKAPPAFKGRTVQKFRVAYWATKAKVCRPYSNSD